MKGFRHLSITGYAQIQATYHIFLTEYVQTQAMYCNTLFELGFVVIQSWTNYTFSPKL